MSDRITIACPSCSAKLTIADESKLGQKIRCPKCSESFVAQAAKPSGSKSAKCAKPKASDENEFDFDQSEMDNEQVARPTKSKTSGTKKKSAKSKSNSGRKSRQTPLIVGGSVAVLLLLGIGGYLLFGGKTDSTPAAPPAQAGAATDLAAGASTSPATTAPTTATPASDVKPNSTTTGLELPGAEPGIPDWVGQRPDEPFHVKEFLTSRAAPADNAAPGYLLALADLSIDMSFVYPAAEWQQRLPQVQTLSQAINNAADNSKLRSGVVPLNEVERVLTLAQPTIDKVNQAQQRPACVFVTGLRLDSLLPHAQAMRQLARLSVVELFSARNKGDYAKTHQAVARMLRVSRDLRPRGMLICQLVSIAIEAVTLTAVADFTLSQPELTAEHCDQLIGLLAAHQRDGIDHLQEGLRVEYILTQNAIRDLQSGRYGLRELNGIVGNAASGRVVTPAQFASLNWETEIVASGKAFSMMLGHVGKSLSELPPDYGSKVVEQLRSQDAKLTAMLAPDTVPCFEAARRAKARLAGAIGLVAVRRFQLAHGSLPTDFTTALTEAKLTTPLLDPYSGKPMLYTVVNGKPVVYSVGSDLIDQGGQVDWNSGQQPGDFLFAIGE